MRKPSHPLVTVAALHQWKAPVLNHVTCKLSELVFTHLSALLSKPTTQCETSIINQLWVLLCCPPKSVKIDRNPLSVCLTVGWNVLPLDIIFCPGSSLYDEPLMTVIRGKRRGPRNLNKCLYEYIWQRDSAVRSELTLGWSCVTTTTEVATQRLHCGSRYFCEWSEQIWVSNIVNIAVLPQQFSHEWFIVSSIIDASFPRC